MTSSGQQNSSFSDALARLGLFGSLLCGILGLLVSVICVMVPGLHFLLGPFGPFIGGLVVGRLSNGRTASLIIAVTMMAVGMAMIAAAFTGSMFGQEPTSGLAKAAPFIVFLYTGVFSFVGVVVGGLISAPSTIRN